MLREEAISELQEKMLNVGISPPATFIFDGRLRRFGRKKSSWYVLFEDQVRNKKFIGGAFGDWRLGGGDPLKINFRKIESNQNVNKDDLREIHKRIKRTREAEALERVLLQEASAKVAEEIWKVATPISENNLPKYLINKKLQNIQTKNLRVIDLSALKDVLDQHGVENKIHPAGTALCVPMLINKNKRPSLASIQVIFDNGFKMFLRGGRVENTYIKFGQIKDDKPIYFAESVSTGGSVFLSEGSAVICCFNASNLYKVVVDFRNLFPNKEFVICADNDQFIPADWPENKEYVNTGQKYAELASQETDAIIATPMFKSLENKPTDFNDLHCIEGLDMVREQLEVDLSFYQDIQSSWTYHQKLKEMSDSKNSSPLAQK